LIFLSSISLFSQSKFEIKGDSSILVCSDEVLKLLANQEINEKDDPDMVLNIIRTAGGIHKNTAWCYALQFFAFEVCNTSLNPLHKTLVANNGFNYAAKKGRKVKYEVKLFDLIFWKKQSSWQGHTERVIKVLNRNWVITIGGNTSKDNSNIRNGGGVYFKQRNLNAPLSRLLLVRGIIGFNY
jgi:hypothetical protein